jgi:hypothetical protein
MNANHDNAAAAVAALLAEPFPVSQLKWLPKTIKGDKALALPYISAADVQNRLDKSVGIAGWRDDYDVLPCGAVVCTLSQLVGDAWIAKQDVGSPSEQPDEHDRVKAAFSDALKRAAAKWGVARYLRYLKPTWVAYDPIRKQIDLTKLPAFPAWAVPSANGSVNGKAVTP